MKIANQKCINHLGYKNMKTAKGRNIIAVIAIALTALLFTALFTILGSITYSFEQSNFRQIGTCSHGEFKRLTYEQYEILKQDKDIDEYGLRRVAGIASGENFQKHIVEVSYCNANAAKWMYLTPTEGRLPNPGTKEIATDKKVLSLLGAKGALGEEINLIIDIDGVEITETFTLCGIWDYDSALPVSHILVSEDTMEELISANTSPFLDKNLGTYGLDIMLKNDSNIEESLLKILDRNGFQGIDTLAENYIAIGVNWGYLSSNKELNLSSESIFALAIILLFIIGTGYLIIFNVFRISVVNDIRHYGLLKTIGTTGRQIRRIVFLQAMTLSATGIPLGLLLGWLVGTVLTPVVMEQLNIYDAGISANLAIFVFSALFALLTVIISCRKPAKIVSRVSPVEAVRFTESTGKATIRRSKRGISLFGMALANLGRSKGKTSLTVISLALSIVLFILTYTFANSFNMEKYLQNIVMDFIVSDACYFNTYSLWEPDNTITDENITEILKLEGIENSFSAYGTSIEDTPQVFYTEQQIYDNMARYGTINEENLRSYLEFTEKNGDSYACDVQLFGMDKEGFSKIKVLEGELDRLFEDNCIAVEKSNNFKLGDTVTFYFNDFVIKEYTVCAIVDIPFALGYGYSINGDLFLLESEHYIQTVDKCGPLYVAMDIADEYEAAAEEFISSYADKTTLDYTSRSTTEAEFESFRNMFFILGITLSGIVGLIGLLNFTNTILTGIFARKRELAILRSIGMTGKQLKAMLIYEGLFYTTTAVFAGLVLNLLTIPASSVIESIFWFCDYKFTPVPVLIAAPVFTVVGIVLPLITYGIFSKRTVVERLRDVV